MNDPLPPAAGAPAAPRPDLYGPAHKALRRELGDALQALGRLDADDEAERRATLRTLGAVLALLRTQLRLEDDFLHTALEARRPAAAMRSAGEHIEQRLAIADLEQEAASLQEAPAPRRALLAQRLYHRFGAFVAEQLMHMQREAGPNNAMLWALYADEDLRALQRRQLAALPPCERDALLLSLARSLPPRELAEPLAALAGVLQGEALVGTLARIAEALDPPRADRLQQHLRAALAMAPPAAPTAPRPPPH